MHHFFKFFKEIFKWRRREDDTLPNRELKFYWREIHRYTVWDYFSDLSSTCDFREPASCPVELQHVFTAPRLKKFNYESQSCMIKKHQVVEAFICFLLRLLYHETDSIAGPCSDRIKNLEKELRYLLTILGGTSLVMRDEHDEFQNLLAEFETVANEAGSLVLSLFVSTDRVSGETDEGLAVVLSHIDLLKDKIVKLLDLLSSNRRSAYTTPKTSVMDSHLIVNSLVYDLKDLMKWEGDRIADLKDQIEILHHGLILSKSSIKDVYSPPPSEIGESKEHLMMQIGDMAYEAEYLISSFLAGDAPFWYAVNRLTDINHKIQLTGIELQEITKKYKHGDFKVAKYLSEQSSLQAQRNSKANDVDVTVGLEDKATDILHQLVGETERLQVISILGMPGLGKTTLAKKLYNHPSVNYWFDKLSWCVVSQIYHRKTILTNILNELESEVEKDVILKMEEGRILEHIFKTLKGRRYLIVMDDLWDPNVWDDLRRYFPDDGNGSRILFTTRNKDVAPPDSVIYMLPPLSCDQCWELLEKKVFDNKPCPVELIAIGKKIAANCSGLPLAVVVVAGILSAMDKEKSTWEEVEGNLASYIFDDGFNSVMQILELSYEHLPEHLKPCFLYIGAFHEDKQIPVRKLMRLWIAEGFICKEEEKSLENVAEGYLMELIDKSLVMVAKRRSDGGVKACIVHDLLRDLCLKLSEDENFRKFAKSNTFTIYEKGHRTKALHHILASYNGRARCFHGCKLISPLYIRDMRLLRVLHCNCFDDFQFSGIEYLVNLRYLVITHLPPSIGSLVSLEYLLVGDNMHWITAEIAKMMKLRYLKVPFGTGYDEDCNTSLTNNLEFLSGVEIRELKDEEMLRCSPHLRKLKCGWDHTFFTMTKTRYKHIDLGFLTQLESLNMRFYGRKIDEISFPSNIKKLSLYSFVSKCPWNIMLTIGRLENLEVLKFRYIDIFWDKRWDTRDGGFQKLRFLELHEMKNLMQWNVDSSDHFPKLQRLIVSGCGNLQEIPCEIGEIATLQLIEVKGRCTESLVESAERIQQEQLNMGNEELKVIIM